MQGWSSVTWPAATAGKTRADKYSFYEQLKTVLKQKRHKSNTSLLRPEEDNIWPRKQNRLRKTILYLRQQTNDVDDECHFGAVPPPF